MSTDLGFTHRFVPGRSRRTLLLLHGTGGNEEDLLPLGTQLDPDAALLSPRGKVLERGMPRFFRRLAEGIFDEKDLIFRTHELAAFLRAAAAQYGLTTNDITAVGYSNGANVAASLMLLHPGLLRRAVLWRAMVPLTPQPLPDLSGSEVLLLSGLQDPILPPEGANRLEQLLQQAGAGITHQRQAAGHGLIPSDLQQARDWISLHAHPASNLPEQSVIV